MFGTRFVLAVVIGLFPAVVLGPRCGKTFSVEGWWSPSLRGRSCTHCGLELGT